MNNYYRNMNTLASCQRSWDNMTPDDDPIEFSDIPKEYHVSECCGCEIDRHRRCTDCGLFAAVDYEATAENYYDSIR